MSLVLQSLLPYNPQCYAPRQCCMAAAIRLSQQHSCSFDHLIGAGEHRRHLKTERLRGLQIDHQLVLVRRLHRQVGWLFALEDAADIAGGALRRNTKNGLKVIASTTVWRCRKTPCARSPVVTSSPGSFERHAF